MAERRLEFEVRTPNVRDRTAMRSYLKARNASLVELKQGAAVHGLGASFACVGVGRAVHALLAASPRWAPLVSACALVAEPNKQPLLPELRVHSEDVEGVEFVCRELIGDDAHLDVRVEQSADARILVRVRRLSTARALRSALLEQGGFECDPPVWLPPPPPELDAASASVSAPVSAVALAPASVVAQAPAPAAGPNAAKKGTKKGKK